MSKSKVDLDLLKRLVSELESALSVADGIKTDVGSQKNEYVVEMSKAIGFAAGIMAEAGMLMGDIQHTVQQAGAPPVSPDFSKLLNFLKGPGSTN